MGYTGNMEWDQPPHGRIWVILKTEAVKIRLYVYLEAFTG